MSHTPALHRLPSLISPCLLSSHLLQTHTYVCYSVEQFENGYLYTIPYSTHYFSMRLEISTFSSITSYISDKNQEFNMYSVLSLNMVHAGHLFVTVMEHLRQLTR